jgi:HD superfamily phosphohydrolase
MKSSFFEGVSENIIYKEKKNNDNYNTILTKWASHFLELKQKGLIPLFITGAGVSMDVEPKIPNIYGIIDLLREIYDKKSIGKIDDVNELFRTLDKLKDEDKKDRGTVARLLTAFQETDSLKSIWEEFNDELIKKIINANRSTFHQELANIHRKYNAVTLTLNFDGLLIREFEQYGRNADEKAFSLPTGEECENFFLRHKNQALKDEYLEIQIRGDIFYVKCDSDGFCPQKGRQHSLWAYIASYPSSTRIAADSPHDATFFRKCHACGQIGKSFLSFPGSYDKEKSMREMLEVVWKYLSFRIGSVTVAGCSGEWDPLLIAFIGDLLTERDIPMLVIDNEPEKKGKSKYLIEELVNPNTHDSKAIGVDAQAFIKDFAGKLSHLVLPFRIQPTYRVHASNDKYWSDIFENHFRNISDKINKLSQVETALITALEDDKLHKFSQLGLKSFWLGIDQNQKDRHNRYHHSLGVMKIASYLYDVVTKKAAVDNPYERQFLRIAALMHDIGHLPFSHLIESVFNELNWKPADYKEQYSHEYQTEKRIDELFFSSTYKDPLMDIGYSVVDLKKLINGCFGVGYLDAIINSPIDSDKIDYVFRDTEFTERKISLDPVQFLKDIINDLTITPETHLSFSGISAIAGAQLIEARQHLYKHLYLQPGIVILEGIVKLIIKTFFVHSIDMDDRNIIKKMDFDTNDYPDLGEYKIHYCISKLMEIVDEIEGEVPCEKEIIDAMFKNIEEKKIYLNDRFMQNLTSVYKIMCETRSNEAINEIENSIIHMRIKLSKERISEIIRDVSFRFPGAAIIDAVATQSYLSTADSRKKRERSDGTQTYSECIMVPKGDYHLWNPTHLSALSLNNSSLNEKKDENIFIYIYPMSGELNDSYFKQAVNLFDKLLEKK